MLARRDLVECFFDGLSERQLGRAFKDENGFSVGVAQVVGDLAWFKQHVQRDDDGTRLHDAVVDDREKWQIWAAQRDLIAMADAHFYERMSDAIREPVELAEAQANTVPDYGLILRREPRVVRNDTCKIERCSAELHDFAWERGQGMRGLYTNTAIEVDLRCRCDHLVQTLDRMYAKSLVLLRKVGAVMTSARFLSPESGNGDKASERDEVF